MTRNGLVIATVVVSALGVLPGHTSAQSHTPAKTGVKAPVKAGDTFKDCRNCPEMVVIPAGSFMMGSPATETGHRENEPQSRVTIARAFAVGKTEVTWDQWEACVRDRGCDGLAIESALRLKNDGTPNPDFVDTRPVVGVSWYDAQAYVGWLNQKTGLDDVYRLLSDAEWEYAARAGTTTAYPWGNTLDHNYGNFGKEEPGLGGKAEGRDVWLDQTAPVASFPPNAFGLYDMHGNAFEWIEDCNEPDRAHQPPDGSANRQGSCRTRMFRSGSFVSNPYMHRSAKRTAPYPPQTRGRNYLTIRVAKTLE